MFYYLKAKNHKAIQTVELKDIGNINVLCGKNNSGKTSILEALNSGKTRAVGVSIKNNHIAELKKRFSDIAKGYTTPNPDTMRIVLNETLDIVLQEENILFSDDIDSKNSYFNDLIRKDIKKKTKIQLSIAIALNELLKEVLKEDLKEPKTILIPPKRTLEHQVQIDVNPAINPDGHGIVNHLFYLKNQPLRSSEHNTYIRINNAFEEIADSWFFNIFPDRNNKLTVHFQQENSEWRGSDVCGLGLADVLIILSSTLANDCDLILIEEPESHIHPDMQRRLLRFFKTLKDRQFIITTHSNVFLDNAFVERVFFCAIDGGGVKVDDSTSKASVLDDLGYSVVDNLVSDLVILVEGPKDVQVLEVFFDKMGLGEHNIRIWPLGGDIMDQVDLSVMVENRHCIALIDKDPESKKVRNHFTKKCEELDIECTQLNRYAIENYFSLRALIDVFGRQIDATVEEIKPDKKLEDQIGLNVKKNSRRIAQAMTIQEIEEAEDLYEFLQKVKGICEDKN